MVPIAAPANSRDLSALSEIVRQVAVAQHLHLVLFIAEAFLQARPERQVGARVGVLEGFVEADGAALDQFVEVLVRSEERRVGKECRSRRFAHLTKKNRKDGGVT